MTKSHKVFSAAALLICLSFLYSCSISYISDPTDPDLITTSTTTKTNIVGSTTTLPSVTEASGDGTAHETKKDGTSLTSVFEEPSGNKKPSGGINTDRFTTDKNGNSTNDDKTTISSDKYLIKGRLETEDGLIPYTVAHSGDNYSIAAQMSGVTVIAVSTKTNMYLLSPDKKVYCDAAALKASMDEELKSVNETADRRQVGTGTEKVDGVTLKYIEYDDASIDYYYGNNLVKQVSYNENGEKTVLYVDEVSGEVASSNFKIPSGYTLVPTDQFMTVVLSTESATAGTKK